MVGEALEIMEKIGKLSPFMEGKYWSASYPNEVEDGHDDQHKFADFSPTAARACTIERFATPSGSPGPKPSHQSGPSTCNPPWFIRQQSC